jgi:hypothetical protein
MLIILLPLTLVDGAIDRCEYPEPGCLALQPAPHVPIPRSMSKHTLAMTEVILPASFVTTAILPDQYPLTLLLGLEPLSFIETAVLELEARQSLNL